VKALATAVRNKGFAFASATGSLKARPHWRFENLRPPHGSVLPSFRQAVFEDSWRKISQTEISPHRPQPDLALNLTVLNLT
jgi:hypothetical protein